jgi:hypothetical protein
MCNYDTLHLSHINQKIEWHAMSNSTSRQKNIHSGTRSQETRLSQWNVLLDGDWSRQEVDRIANVFQRISEGAGGKPISTLFNGQTTFLQHSGRPGRVGRTRGAYIYLDKDWTDWTFAHELGHRWNNAWNRQPERLLRQTVGAGKLEWLKMGLRRFEKWLEKLLRRLGFNGRLDWRALWYHPGDAPPPCGVDRNFNASEDLAESFAGIIFQDDAQNRAQQASERMGHLGERWNWPLKFAKFSATPRGQSTIHLLNTLTAKEKGPDQAN